MDFVNETGLAAGWTMGFERDGREVMIVAVKATFAIPGDDAEPELATEQTPLVEAEEFTGSPGFSAPRYESDYAHRKPMCDVLLNGSAYAPRGKQASQINVTVRIGAMAKTFAVVGNRVWRQGVFGIRASEPEPFAVMPISYDNAFGGVDDTKGDPTNVRSFLENPVGRGYAYYKDKIDGRPLPNTEERGHDVVDPSGSYRPMSFGALGRNWRTRVQYAGTYDQHWLDNRAPFWPDDFDYRYFQAAPPDQQIPYPSGGEEVLLKNLTPAGQVVFRLPKRSVPVWFLPYRGRDARVDPVLDTILIEPDRGVFMLGWRAALPMRQSCFDVRQVIVGERSDAWVRARQFGNKPYYRNLEELARARRR